MVRFWNLAEDENYVLGLSDFDYPNALTDKALCVSYCPRKRLIAVGTAQGVTVFWKCEGGSASSTAASWQPLPPCSVSDRLRVESLCWSSSDNGLVAAATSESVRWVIEGFLRCIVL